MDRQEFTVAEYAKMERVTKQTVWRWIAKGAVAVRRTPGGRIRIRTTNAGSPVVLRLDDRRSNS